MWPFSKKLELQFELEYRLTPISLDEVRTFRVQNSTVEWVYFTHRYYSTYQHQITGKWVHHDTPDRLEEIAFRLRSVISEGLSAALKYKPVLNNPTGPFAHFLPPICVYSTEGCKEHLRRELVTKYRLCDAYWQSNEDTRRLHNRLQARGISSESY